MFIPAKKKGPRTNKPKFVGKMRLRVGDNVRVITGKDKGKEGKITRVIPAEGKVVIEGINIIIKHQKPRQQAAPGGTVPASAQGGRIEMAAPLAAAKVQLLDPGQDGAVTRVGIKTGENGERVRFARKSGGVIENA